MSVQLVLACLCGFVFFFKQKTAYEMRISDWSSDVCSSDLALGFVEFPDHLVSPAGQCRALAIRMRAMSDKSALPDLPAGWTGTAPDADALFAMAEAALATMPDAFKPHIEGVVISIEEFAEDEVLASLDIEQDRKSTRLNSSH